MASHSAMLEVAPGEGSNSSDSIVSISRSGASSISATATTLADINHTTDIINQQNQDLASQVHRLREEKKLLEGRIRGYKTLSDLLVESKKENQKLKAQVMELEAKQDELTSKQSAAEPAGKDLAQLDMTKVSLNGTEHEHGDLPSGQTAVPPAAAHSCSSGLAGSRALDPPEKGPPSSLQETARPPPDSEETRLVSLPSTGARSKSGSAERTPMQESLGPVSNVSQAGSDSTENVASSPDRGDESGPHASGSPEVLQLDSDKYDEATYEKVGLRLGMGHSSFTSSMYAAGSERTEARPEDFPSLSSGLSGGLVHPSVPGGSGSILNPPFVGMMHPQSFIGQASDTGDLGLAAEVETISEQLNSEPGDGSPAIAFQMHAIAERIARVEQKKEDQKKLIQTLMAENQGLKRQLRLSDNSHQVEIMGLREENTRLMQQLKQARQGPGQESTLPKSASLHNDWVHVERPLNMGDTGMGSEQPLVDRVRKLEQDKAELHRANSNWKARWDQMEQEHQLRISELRSKLVMAEQELANSKSVLAEQSREFETHMLELKRRCGEEESAKEEAVHQHHLSERKCLELQDQLTEMRTQLSDTARDKQALTAELSILKARTASQETQAAGSAAGTLSSNPVLEAEIAMLRQQLTVYLEDFEHEREDRTAAQLARDTAKKNAETIGRMNHQLSSQIKHMQKQMKDRDDTITTTLRQNEALQRQVADYKKKLAAEWEQKQGIQRALLAQQQQQQQQHQQSLRNLYLSPELYPPAQPLYQNPLPPPAFPPTTQYFSGCPNSQPTSRLGATAVSPEHLPGAWTCASCTYVNYPGRTVCEMCGLVNSPRGQAEGFGFMSSENMYGSGDHPLLMSRGNEQRQAGGGNGDLVTDSGMPPIGIALH